MTIYTLNEEGRKQVGDYVKAHATPWVVNAWDQGGAEEWYNDVDCGENCLGHLEIASRYTATGNPVTVTFGPECFDAEEIAD